MNVILHNLSRILSRRNRNIPRRSRYLLRRGSQPLAPEAQRLLAPRFSASNWGMEQVSPARTTLRFD